MALETILNQYPYFQGIRALYLKGLYDLKSYRYNFELKKTAAYTSDRAILFDFITSEKFVVIQPNNSVKETKEVEVDNFFIVPNFEISENETIEKFKKTNDLNTGLLSEIEEKLEINKPLQFDFEEKHSFSEWLQLNKFEPIERDLADSNKEIIDYKKKKIEIIDRFIETNPKIGPIKENTINAGITAKSKEEPSHLMTETLARIYLEQKKYKKAIQAYEILILKYPEKSIFFAKRIKDIKDIQ